MRENKLAHFEQTQTDFSCCKCTWWQHAEGRETGWGGHGWTTVPGRPEPGPVGTVFSFQGPGFRCCPCCRGQGACTPFLCPGTHFFSAIKKAEKQWNFCPPPHMSLSNDTGPNTFFSLTLWIYMWGCHFFLNSFRVSSIHLCPLP